MQPWLIEKLKKEKEEKRKENRVTLQIPLDSPVPVRQEEIKSDRGVVVIDICDGEEE